MLKIILLHASYLGTGLILLNALPRAREYPRSIKWCMGYFTGVCVHVLVLLVCLEAGITAHSVPWFLVAAGLLALIYATLWEIKMWPPREITKKSSIPQLVVMTLAFALLVPSLWLISVELVGVPEVSYDSTAFWNLKAKYFFFGEDLSGDAFHNPLRVHPHKNYPLYRPIFAYENFAILGNADDFATKPGFWIYNMVGLLLLGVQIKKWTGTLVAVMAVGILLYTPLWSYLETAGSIATTYADFPLSVMLAASAGFLLRYFQGDEPLDLAGAMVSVSSALLLKQEGMVWLAVFLPLAFVALWNLHGTFFHRDHWWFILPILLLAFWLIIRSSLPGGSDLNRPTWEQLRLLPDVFPKVGDAWLHRLLDVHLWGFMPELLAIGFLIGMVRSMRTWSVVIALMAIAMVVSSFLVTMLLEIQIGQIDIYTRFLYDRLALQLVPLFLLLAVGLNTLNPNPGTRRATQFS